MSLINYSIRILCNMVLVMFGRLDDDMIGIITTSFGKERMLRRGGGASLPKRENSVRVLDPEKAESIEILLRALNVTTEDVCGALLDGKHLCH